MRYGWDENKRQENLRKHGVDFTAIHSFTWEASIRWIDDREDYGEVREVAVGFIGVALHIVVFTEHRRRPDLDHQPAKGRTTGSSGNMSERYEKVRGVVTISREQARRMARADIDRITDEEDAAITAAALLDPDNLPADAGAVGSVPADGGGAARSFCASCAASAARRNQSRSRRASRCGSIPTWSRISRSAVPAGSHASIPRCARSRSCRKRRSAPG